MFSWNKERHGIMIIAHRGSSATTPENTLAAFRQAMEDGVDAIELDVRLTKDKHVVVIHDSSLERTTNGKGKVRNCALEELKSYSAGQWFDSRFHGERVPSLAEVFELTQGTIGVNIELKQEGRHPDMELIEKTLDVIRKYHNERSVLITSFHHSLIKQVRQYHSTIATGVLYHPLYHIQRSPVQVVKKANAESFICSKRIIRKKAVDSLRQFKFSSGVYSVNTQKELERAIHFGLNYIFTDNPAFLLKLGILPKRKIPHLGD